MAPAPAPAAPAAAMAGDGCSGGEETVRIPGEAWGWETLGGEGKAEQGRGGVAAFWSMREGGDETKARGERQRWW